MRVTTRAALGVAAVAAGVYAARRAATWVENTLAQIDEAFAFAALDEDQDEDQGDDQGHGGFMIPDEDGTCVCGSSDHKAHTTAVLETPAELANGEFGPLPLQAIFEFHQSDPFAVNMTLMLDVYRDQQFVGRDQQTWCYARDIIDTALSCTDDRMVGDGDVQAQYVNEDDELYIWLTDVAGESRRVTVPAGGLRHFMAASFKIVPAGSETYDAAVDSEIGAIFGGEQ